VDDRCSLDIVYLDLAKAFDKVPRQRLLNKLKAYGVHGKFHVGLQIGCWAEDSEFVCKVGVLSGDGFSVEFRMDQF